VVEVTEGPPEVEAAAVSEAVAVAVEVEVEVGSVDADGEVDGDHRSGATIMRQQYCSPQKPTIEL
jgi:hypothetical protein